MRAHAALIALLCCGPALAGAKPHELKLTWSGTLPAKQALFVENLLGEIEVEGGTGNAIEVEARVFAEGPTETEARSLAEAVRLQAGPGEGGTRIQLVYPVELADAYRLPDAARSSRWYESLAGMVTGLFDKDGVISTEYGGRTVRLAKGKEATPLAVHLRVRVPQGRELTLRQAFGEVALQRLRGRVTVRCEHARVTAEQLFGSLSVEAVQAPVALRSFQGERLAVKGQSGKIELVDVKAGQIDLDAGSGRVEGRTVQAERFVASASAGGVLLDDFSAVEFEIEATTGDLDLAPDLRRTRQGRLRTESGEIRLQVGGFLPFAVDARTDTGSVAGSGPALEVQAESKRAAIVKRGRGGPALEADCDKCSIKVLSR